MSGYMTGLVWAKYPGGGNDFKLALALADGAGDSGEFCLEESPRLLRQARLTERDFRRALASMQVKGWLRPIEVHRCLYRLGPDMPLHA